MKLIAYILVCSMVFLGLNRFTESLSFQDPQAEMACDMDCCESHDDCCGDEAADDQGDQDGSDHRCPSGCDCSCCFQVVAIEYHILTFFGAAPQAAHYAAYHNSYHFEYLTPLFQPPRFS